MDDMSYILQPFLGRSLTPVLLIGQPHWSIELFLVLLVTLHACQSVAQAVI